MRLARLATDSGSRYVMADGDHWVEIADPFVTDPAPTGPRNPMAGA